MLCSSPRPIRSGSWLTGWLDCWIAGRYRHASAYFHSAILAYQIPFLPMRAQSRNLVMHSRSPRCIVAHNCRKWPQLCTQLCPASQTFDTKCS